MQHIGNPLGIRTHRRGTELASEEAVRYIPAITFPTCRARSEETVATIRGPRLTAAATLLALLGLGALAGGLTSGIFRDSEGRLDVAGLLPLVLGSVAILWSVTVGSRFRRAAWWGGLALAGQTASLLLTRAGTALRYQHFVPLPPETVVAAIALGILAFQAVVVVVAVGRAGLLQEIRKRASAGRLAVVAGLWFVSSATVSANLGAYPVELVLAFGYQLLQLATIVFAVTSLPVDTLRAAHTSGSRWLGVLGDPPGEEPPPLDRVVLGAALFAAAMSALLSVLVFQRHPHVPDEVAYLLHANYLAHGKLVMPLPPVREAFEIYMEEFTARGWFVVTPPGWPAVLAIGAFFGVPWLVNPVLLGCNVLLGFLVLRALFSPRTARLAILLFAVSPWNLFLGMSFMTHQLTLTLALLATLGVMRARRTGLARWALLGGGALGWIGVTRQLDGLIMALALGLWAIGLGGRRLKTLGVAALVGGALLGASPVLGYNAYLTGHPGTFPIMAYTSAHYGPNANAYGFGPDRGMGWPLDPRPGHDVLDGILNSNLNLTTIHTDLFGWSIGSLTLVFVMLVMGGRRWTQSDRVMGGFAALVIALYFPNYFSGGPDFAGRYWHLMIIPLAVLTARGAERLTEIVARRTDPTLADGGILAGLALLTLLATMTFLPWRSLDKYRDFRGMRADVRDLAAAERFGDALVLIEGREMPDYASAATYNPVNVNGPGPVFAWDRSPEVRRRLLEAYPDRPVWRVAGPSLTGEGFRIVERPLERAATPPDEAGPRP